MWRPRMVSPFRSSRSRSAAPRVVAMAGASLEKIADKLGAASLRQCMRRPLTKHRHERHARHLACAEVPSRG